ncbi:MAG: hypothetical protein HC907_38870, partial [Richelia sp. SM1_7_0]|nr:hypothetical protein [Richelia sp. SM1_7_0]
AGDSSVPGTTEESSSFSGDNFSPNAGGSTGVEIAPGTEASITNGRIVISDEIRARVSRAIMLLARERGDSSNRIVLALLTNVNGGSASELQSQLQSSFASFGVSPILTANLVSNLFSMADIRLAELQETPEGETTPVGSITSIEDLLSREGVLLNIDIDKLEAAINAYNQLVSESSPEVLEKLSKDASFRFIGRILKESRRMHENEERWRKYTLYWWELKAITIIWMR